jgi:hypothetical protein
MGVNASSYAPDEGVRLSELACEILDLFRSQHRRPGARMRLVEVVDARLHGSDPAVAAAVSELTGAAYLRAPDADTIELTARGFDAVQRGDYRASG